MQIPFVKRAACLLGARSFAQMKVWHRGEIGKDNEAVKCSRGPNNMFDPN